VEGSFVTAAGRIGAVEGMKADVELHLKTPLKDDQKDELTFGIEAVLRELESSVSTAALTR
jgi:hypothetical protein